MIGSDNYNSPYSRTNPSKLDRQGEFVSDITLEIGTIIELMKKHGVYVKGDLDHLRALTSFAQDIFTIGLARNPCEGGGKSS